MSEACEILLDTEAFRHREIKLATPPDDMWDHDLPRPWRARDWANAYHGMISYGAALAAAGFRSEAELKAAKAPVLIVHAIVEDDGTLLVCTSSLRRRVSPAEIFAAHGQTVPYGAIPHSNDNESPSP